MALPVDTQKSSSNGIFQKLPRLSTFTWLIVIIGLVLVAAVPLITSYSDQIAKQGPLKEKLAKLKAQDVSLQQQLSSQGSLTSQINSLKLEVESTKARYGNACNSVDTSRALLDLAWQYDVTIVSMAASPATVKIEGKDYAGTSYVLALSGQVSNFQNFLVGLGKEFASSQPADVLIQPATQVGMLDHATLTLTVVCNQ